MSSMCTAADAVSFETVSLPNASTEWMGTRATALTERSSSMPPMT